MPVKDHNEMLSQQFLLATQKPNHPNYIDLNATPDGTEGYTFDHDFHVVVCKQCCTENVYAGHQHNIFI